MGFVNPLAYSFVNLGTIPAPAKLGQYPIFMFKKGFTLPPVGLTANTGSIPFSTHSTDLIISRGGRFPNGEPGAGNVRCGSITQQMFATVTNAGVGPWQYAGSPRAPFDTSTVVTYAKCFPGVVQRGRFIDGFTVGNSPLGARGAGQRSIQGRSLPFNPNVTNVFGPASKGTIVFSNDAGSDYTSDFTGFLSSPAFEYSCGQIMGIPLGKGSMFIMSNQTGGAGVCFYPDIIDAIRFPFAIRMPGNFTDWGVQGMASITDGEFTWFYGYNSTAQSLVVMRFAFNFSYSPLLGFGATTEIQYRTLTLPSELRQCVLIPSPLGLLMKQWSPTTNLFLLAKDGSRYLQIQPIMTDGTANNLYAGAATDQGCSVKFDQNGQLWIANPYTPGPNTNAVYSSNGLVKFPLVDVPQFPPISLPFLDCCNDDKSVLAKLAH